MSLRVSDDDRPGYAILDFGRDTGTDDLLISLQSKLFNTGEYLGPGGKWSKAPHFFKAVRLTSAGPGIYRIGPEIVNQQDLAHDTIEVSVGSGGVVEEATWPELTPAPFEPGTAIYREPVPPPPQEPIRPASKPAAESPPRVVEERPAKEDAGTPVTKTPAWLKFGVPAAALFFVVMLSSWLFCTPFGFLCRTPLDLAIACAKSKSPSESCDAARCFEGFLALNSPGEERVRAERLKEPYDYQCKVAFQNAKSCAESNRADPCAARQCFEEFLKDPQAPRENRADAERLAANLKLTCEAKKRDDADKDAAAKAETCIGENGRPPCRNSENCLAAYVASSPSGGERERLSRLARETFEKCKGEAVRIERANAARDQAAEAQRKDDEAFEIAKGCAEHAECSKKRACYDLYRNGFPNGTHIGEVERAIASFTCYGDNPSGHSVTVLPDGMYKGRASREDSCAAKADPVIVKIKDGRICWEHGLGFENKWEGSVSAGGAVDAKVRGRSGTSASGSAINGGAMSIDMTYPECRNPIHIQLGGMIPGTPAPCR